MIKQVLKMETKEKVFIKGLLGNEYEFNMLLFNGDFLDLSKKICDDYSGIFVLTRYQENSDTPSHEFLYCNASCDISKALQELAHNDNVVNSGANCICYYYEPSELVRNDAYNDLLKANTFPLN